MQKLFVTILISIFTGSVMAQTNHKIVFDLSSGDTVVQSTLLRQLNNVLNAAPDAQLEVVVHGHAVFMFVKSKAYFESKMNELKARGKLTYKICANAMKRLQVEATDLVPAAEVVPTAMLELSGKQAEGWSYIKSAQ